MAIEGASVKRVAYVRLATKVDVPVLKLLFEDQAKFEKLAFEATETALESGLFQLPPFLGPTVLLLELGSPPPSPQRSTKPTEDVFQEKCLEVGISTDIQDKFADSFISSRDESRTVVGLIHVYPSYSSCLAKGGFCIGDLFVKEGYRRQGLGKFLLQTVAQEAAKRKLGRVEWNVLEWNANAIKFYQSMGAVLLPDWRCFRLSGDALENYAESSSRRGL